MPVARPACPPALAPAWAAAWGLAAALTLAGAPRAAHADCQPDPATNGDTVTCSADDTDGFDAGVEDNLTVIVEGTATVDDGVADTNAITLNDENAVTIEAGAEITADGAGSHGLSIGNDHNDDDLDGDGVTNAGRIVVTGDNAGGISGGNANEVTNSGAINAGVLTTSTGAFGIRLGDDAVVTNETSGTIDVLGNDVVGIEAGAGAVVTNQGRIAVGFSNDTTVSSIGVDVGDDALVTNEAGATLGASGEDPIGLRMGSDTTPDLDADLVNQGTISASGGTTSATGAIVGDGVFVQNMPGGVIQATGNESDTGETVIGLQLGADTTLENDGRTQTFGAESTAILVLGGPGSTTTITNGPTGQILTPFDPDDPDDPADPVDGSVAIQGGDGIEIVTHQGAVNGIIDLAGDDDVLTLFTGASFDDLIGGAGTDALVLDGGGLGFLDLDRVSGFESLTIDAQVTDPDTSEDFFGAWELLGSLPDSLPGGLTLTNGTLQLRDDVTFSSATGFVMDAGTTLRILANPNAVTDGTLIVTGGGNLDLSALDNTLEFIQIAPLPTSTSITILEAQGGGSLLGVFENVPEDTPLLDFEVSHLASRVVLDITRFSFGVVAETPNQRVVGRHLDRLLATGGNNAGVDAVLIALDGLDTAQLRRAYDSLQPEAYDAHTGQIAALGRAFAEAALEPRLLCKPAFFGLDPGPLRDIPCGRTGFAAWMKLLFSESDRDGDGDFFDSDATRQAVAGGFDWRPDRRVTVTGYIGIGSVDVDVSDVGTGDIQSFEIGAAASARLGGARLRATLGYGRGDHEQDRELVFGSTVVNTEGEFDSNRIQSLVELGWLFELGDFQIEPLARLDVTWVQEDAFSESDLGGFELDVDERENVLVGTQFGARFRYRHYQSAYADDVIPYTQGTWTPEISASWRSLWTGADRELDARLVGANGAAGDFTIDSEDSSQGVDVGAKLTFQPHGSGGSFSVGYDGFIGDKSTDHRFGASLEVYF